MISDYRWRIASSEAELSSGHFFVLGLPTPSFCDYQEASARLDSAGGGQTLLGYSTVVLAWERVLPQTVALIRKQVEAALQQEGVLYLTIPRRSGEGFGEDWVDLRGVPLYPETTVGSLKDSGLSLQRVTLTVRNVQTVNDPSTVY